VFAAQVVGFAATIASAGADQIAEGSRTSASSGYGVVGDSLNGADRNASAGCMCGHDEAGTFAAGADAHRTNVGAKFKNTGEKVGG
jgi:hypothetical protein